MENTSNDKIAYFPYVAGVLAFAYEYRNQNGKIKKPLIFLWCTAAFGIRD